LITVTDSFTIYYYYETSNFWSHNFYDYVHFTYAISKWFIGGYRILIFHLFKILSYHLFNLSRVAQWKRAGPITQRSVDRNHALLFVFYFLLIMEPLKCFLNVKYIDLISANVTLSNCYWRSTNPMNIVVDKFLI
jgi:hypothetical protein